MIYGVYSIRDKLTGYLQPAFEVNDPSAMRNFESGILAVQRGNLLHSHPGDYDLFKVGTFDTDTGLLAPCDHVQIASGQSIFLASIKEVSSDV